MESGRSIADLIVEAKLMGREEAERFLDPKSMLGPNRADSKMEKGKKKG